MTISQILFSLSISIIGTNPNRKNRPCFGITQVDNTKCEDCDVQNMCELVLKTAGQTVSV